MNLSTKRKVDVPLIFIVLLSAFLNGYNIWTDKYANTYYTTAVAAMMKNFHNFFYASLDSAGSVTVDKPPVTFWIQTLFAKIFGLYGWSVILPQALAGIGSVLLIYKLLKPTFGLAAARIGALVMACTPIAVAVSRTNNIDSMLVFTLLVATTLLFRGVRKGSVWSVLGAFAVVGVGFNMKMMQAYMVLPAFYLIYLLMAKWGWKKKTGILAGATAILLVISVSWAVAVDSVSADKRPYIGSSGTNSVMNLVFGYNGVSRLTGDRGNGSGGPGGGFPTGQFEPGQSMSSNGDGGQSGNSGFNMPNGAGSQSDSSGSNTPSGDGGQSGNSGFNMPNGDGSQPDSSGSNTPNGDGGQSGNGGFNMPNSDDGRMGNGGFGGMNNGRSGGMFGTGKAGPLRLFQSSLSDQASWLIPFALIGAVALLASIRGRRLTDKQKESLFWLAWLIPVAGFFSVAGFFHQYYLIMLAPPIAALAGAGFSEMWQAYRSRKGWMSWLLPAAVLATALFQWYIVHPYDKTIGRGWSIGILLAGLILTTALVAWRAKESKLSRSFAIAGMMALLIGPLYWAFTPITYGVSSMTPIVGPSSSDNGGFPGGGMGGGNRGGGPGEQSSGVNEAMYSYLKEHNTGEKYLVAVSDYSTAAPYMVDKGESVVIMNGFNSSDQVYTVDKLKALVEKGEVKYFLIGGGMGGGGRGGNSEVTQWIQENGKAISISGDQSQSSQSDTNQGDGGDGGFGGFGGRGNNATLYEVNLQEGN
ncbi:ArnT family glycosyltransferase [Gorillibacterium massiliense]|uniref:ArnT family glycosyltransferase n=1 Tax=Gorillibacterium massiliense TaxID=1280390 RepID=UPI0004B107FC|nr:glycosyltransferase family 39 protein [Gorillibacterium massiliense]